MSLLVWIFTVLLVHVALGYIGYSKVIRYVILITPAVILLFSLFMEEALESVQTGKGGMRHTGALLGVVVFAAILLVMEIVSGIAASAAFDKVFS